MKPRIAIVGSGISGLVCAMLLHESHDVVVYEAGSWIGGHTHTVDVEDEGQTHAIDTGFIVFNEKTYPNFVRILDRLGVAAQDSEMSFSVHDESTKLEWNGRDFGSIFAQKRNLLRPSFYGMLRDIVRFNKRAKDLANSSDEQALGDFLAKHRFGKAFYELYLMPMGAAIWSMDPERMLAFPARFFARFFDNHGFLEIDDRPQWRVVSGGSRSYVDAITRGFADRVRTSCPVESVRRGEEGVFVKTPGEDEELFDHAILACHANQSLAMLTDADEIERSVLGAIGFTPNRTTLHTGSNLLPDRRKAVAAWNCRVDRSDASSMSKLRLCYHMNTLQGLPTAKDFCVSLNSDDRIPDADKVGSWDYEHPLFTLDAVAAQTRWAEIDGRRRTHFAGAYWRNGFHEDGVFSALRVCEKFGRAL